MASSGFCTTCVKTVYFESDAHCPVCSGPLVAQKAEEDLAEEVG